MSLALWLRTGRTERGLSLEDVARTTKIQARILERLEGGKLDGLPAEVFVRGFIRSYAKCCGLDQTEALTRYGAASQAQATATAPAMPGTLSAPSNARALVDLSDVAAPIASRISATRPAIEEPAIEAMATEIAAAPMEIAAEASAGIEEAARSYASKKKRRGGKRAKRKSMATGTPPTPTPVVVEAAAVKAARVEVGAEAAPGETAPGETARGETARGETARGETARGETARGEAAGRESARGESVAVDATTADASTDIVVSDVAAESIATPVDYLDPLVEPSDDNEDVVATETWQPKMPPATTTASVPWRRSAYATTSSASVPTLVIDDADPEHAAQVLEDREAATSVLTNAQRRSFLPPILLDREDRSARQGGLTLAVIILLIAATLTLSYLMRRPSSSGDGVTQNDREIELIG